MNPPLTPTGRRSRDLKQIDKITREKGLTLIPKRATQRENVRGIHSRLGGRHNFLALGLEEWPADDI